MTVDDAKIIDLPKILDARGNLSFAENFKQIPFEIKRTYFMMCLGAKVVEDMPIKKMKSLSLRFLVASM